MPVIGFLHAQGQMTAPRSRLLSAMA
jgi:hypothetical protein